jgi:hypothetical protein
MQIKQKVLSGWHEIIDKGGEREKTIVGIGNIGFSVYVWMCKFKNRFAKKRNTYERNKYQSVRL